MPVVFFDTNALYIQGYRDSFTAGSLTADYTPIGVGVRVLHGTEYLANADWSEYTRPDGSGFASPDELMSYLIGQFSMRRLLATVFVQSAPLAQWNIAHGLGFHPAVRLIDSTGDPITGDVRSPDPDTVTVTFASPVSGTAYLS